MLRYRSFARKSRLLTYLVATLALGSVVTAGAVRAADTDGYAKTTQVNVAVHPITCTFSSTVTNTTNFSFDISWIAQARGEYLLADRTHGRPSSNTEGGLLSGATSGDLLLINTDNPGAGATTILPPPNDPFAGHRCDDNAKFGGVVSRNEIEGPNGVFTVNDTQAWVGDGPSDFTPGQTDSATDYISDPCDSSVRVFSLITKQQVAHINVHGCFRTDEGAFDALDQVVLFANPSEQNAVRQVDPRAQNVDHSPFITLISTRAGHGNDRFGDDFGHDFGHGFGGGRGQYQILKQINFDGVNGTIDATGGIEQAVYSRQTGDFYIAVPANNNPGTVGATSADGFVTVVDPTQGHLSVVANYALKTGSCPGGPAGAALGPNHELLLGCGGGGGEVVVDINNIATSTANPTILPDGSLSCDEVAYDAGSGHFGGACFTKATGGGNFTLLVNDAHSQTYDTAIGGANGAHSVAADNTNANFWMPMFGGDCGTGLDCVAVYAPSEDDFASAN